MYNNENYLKRADEIGQSYVTRLATDGYNVVKYDTDTNKDNIKLYKYRWSIYVEHPSELFVLKFGLRYGNFDYDHSIVTSDAKHLDVKYYDSCKSGNWQFKLNHEVREADIERKINWIYDDLITKLNELDTYAERLQRMLARSKNLNTISKTFENIIGRSVDIKYLERDDRFAFSLVLDSEKDIIDFGAKLDPNFEKILEITDL